MNEGKKTGIFSLVAVGVVAIAVVLGWPSRTLTDNASTVGTPLFESFTDPLVASSMKIATYDPELDQHDSFEVRKDRDTGVWSIPSRDGYPADALEHFRNAANALIGLEILDTQTEDPSLHDELGVIEPSLEGAKVGDEGVGRLVTLKDDGQKTLASLIIGKTVPNEAGKVYVRRPGQDPVYVVKLDDSVFATRFQDWIEEDLLQLSSIDIEELEIKDYDASVSPQMQFSLNRNYTAMVKMMGSQWSLDKLLSFNPEDPLEEPQVVEVAADKVLNSTKLNEMKNALDDLKIVNVVRKPKGMSDNLRADKDLLADNDAVASLASRGFFPVSGGGKEDIEVLSANGELSVGLKNGVQYVLRFGNIAGLTDEKDQEKAEGEDDEVGKLSGGVNRYLLVTTRVDESHFPPPDLIEVPQTLEELEALERADEPQPTEPTATDVPPVVEETTDEPVASDAESEEMTADDAPAADAPSDDAPADDAPSDDAPADDAPSDDAPSDDAPADDAPSEDAPADDDAPADGASGDDEPKAEDESRATLRDNGVQLVIAQDEDSADEPATEEPATEEPAIEEPATEEPATEEPATEEPATEEPATEEPATEEPATEEPATEEPATEEPATEEQPAEDAKPSASKTPAGEELTEQEKQELLEAGQEKITKENQRRIDQRKDEIEVAQRRVRELNARFADWYYVIAEDTYRKLRIKRDELFEKPGDTSAAPGADTNDALGPLQFGPPIQQ